MFKKSCTCTCTTPRKLNTLWVYIVQLKRDPESAEWVNFEQLFKMANVEEKSLSREKLIEAAKQKSKSII